MDLIYTDRDGVDIGVVLNYNLDNEISIVGEECLFVLDMPIDEDVLNNCGFIYVDGTEYGGIIDLHTIEPGEAFCIAKSLSRQKTSHSILSQEM
jgi:hypothetical protein